MFAACLSILKNISTNNRSTFELTFNDVTRFVGFGTNVESIADILRYTGVGTIRIAYHHADGTIIGNANTYNEILCIARNIGDYHRMNGELLETLRLALSSTLTFGNEIRINFDKIGYGIVGKPDSHHEMLAELYEVMIFPDIRGVVICPVNIQNGSFHTLHELVMVLNRVIDAHGDH